MHLLQHGFAHLVVMEDDMVVRLKPRRNLVLPGKMGGYDLLFFGTCTNIHANRTVDALMESFSSLLHPPSPAEVVQVLRAAAVD
jgi:hypothetical protein